MYSGSVACSKCTLLKHFGAWLRSTKIINVNDVSQIGHNKGACRFVSSRQKSSADGINLRKTMAGKKKVSQIRACRPGWQEVREFLRRLTASLAHRSAVPAAYRIIRLPGGSSLPHDSR